MFGQAAHLAGGLVALPHCLVDGLLPESDLALLFKVLLAHLLLLKGVVGGGC